MTNITIATDWLLFFVAIVSATGATLIALRGANKKLEKRITDVITKATYPIQPKANGSLSMTDLHKKVDLLTERQYVISQQVIDHIASHDLER